MAMSAPALAKQNRLTVIGNSPLPTLMNFQRMPLREQIMKKPPAASLGMSLSFHCVRTGLEISIASGRAIECSCGRSNHYTPFSRKGNDISFVFSMDRRKILTLVLSKWYSGPTGFHSYTSARAKNLAAALGGQAGTREAVG
jgi:hypothetical protein